MRKIFARVVGIWLLLGLLSGSSFSQSRGVVGEKPLDAASIGTPGAGTVVAALGTVYTGCLIINDPNSSYNLVVDSINTANYVTPSQTAIILIPGAGYSCPGGSVYTITADAQDSGHKIYGRKW